MGGSKMYLDTRDGKANWRQVYKLAISFIQPRPIALVSTVSPAGVPNLAPFSLYNLVSANPPVVMVAPSLRRDGRHKDTLHNIEATGEFVVATVTGAIVGHANQCAFEYPPEVDEFAKSGLTPRAAKLIRPRLVDESPVNIECSLLEVRRFGDAPGAGSVLFGRILAVHVEDAILADDGAAAPDRLDAIGRMGRSTYTRTSSHFDLPLPERG
jgi:flavin reductase (DIM6/NTAB) family NADH-FMN oxidoreductase RutF